MFKITSDSLATFRGVASVIEGLKKAVSNLIQRMSTVEDRLDDIYIAPASASSSGGNGLFVAVDFGATFTHFAQTVVTGETWVSGTSAITATPIISAGISGEEIALMQFSAVVTELNPGVGFTLSVYTPIEAKDTYYFSCIGV